MARRDMSRKQKKKFKDCNLRRLLAACLHAASSKVASTPIYISKSKKKEICSIPPVKCVAG